MQYDRLGIFSRVMGFQCKLYLFRKRRSHWSNSKDSHTRFYLKYKKFYFALKIFLWSPVRTPLARPWLWPQAYICRDQIQTCVTHWRCHGINLFLHFWGKDRNLVPRAFAAHANHANVRKRKLGLTPHSLCTAVKILLWYNWTAGSLEKVSEKWWRRRGLLVINTRKNKKNAQPIASCQQAWNSTVQGWWTNRREQCCSKSTSW